MVYVNGADPSVVLTVMLPLSSPLHSASSLERSYVGVLFTVTFIDAVFDPQAFVPVTLIDPEFVPKSTEADSPSPVAVASIEVDQSKESNAPETV